MVKGNTYLVIGGGIVGVATARALALAHDGEVTLVEKEPRLAAHQSGRNSGVLHAGVYYPPGSLKGRFCREGNARLAEYCGRRGLPFLRTGKLLVAVEDRERPELERLGARCAAAGLTVTDLDARALERTEPNVRGVAALHVAESGIVDYGAVVEALASDARTAGADILLGEEVRGLSAVERGVEVRLSSGRRLAAERAVVCTGVHADRLVRMLGAAPDFAMLPVRGDYYRLTGLPTDLVRHLIYPVPDPALPYLGVHLTRTVSGGLTLGPNAAPALGREAYRRGDIEPAHLLRLALWPGTRRFMMNNARAIAAEWRGTLTPAVFRARASRYCPALAAARLEPLPAGIRAQAIGRDGRLIEDFLFERVGNVLVVCNAPSPAATASLPIADHLVAMIAEDESSPAR